MLLLDADSFMSDLWIKLAHPIKCVRMPKGAKLMASPHKKRLSWALFESSLSCSDLARCCGTRRVSNTFRDQHVFSPSDNLSLKAHLMFGGSSCYSILCLNG